MTLQTNIIAKLYSEVEKFWNECIDEFTIVKEERTLP